MLVPKMYDVMNISVIPYINSTTEVVVRNYLASSPYEYITYVFLYVNVNYICCLSYSVRNVHVFISYTS